MDRTLARRRTGAVGILSCLAVVAFVFGATLGNGSGKAEDPGVAATLPPKLQAGERIVVGVDGSSIGRGLRGAVRAGRVAGVVLFAGSFPTPAAGRRLIAELQAIPRPPKLRSPLLVMVDQEGGQVKRVSGAPTASAATMGARGAAFSREQGRRTAANLRRLGVNVDLAPVLDVARQGGVIAETERGFGTDPARVADTAVAFGGALRSGGIAATGKHFPGFGAARANTDFSVERIGLSKQVLRQIDEVPYRRFIATGGELVMLSTAIYPAFSERPAAFTRAIATGELRERLGFEGVTITDALETPAVEHFGSTSKAAAAGARAGADLLLYTQLGAARTAWRALVEKLRSGALDRAEFESAVDRVLELRSELPR
jgi:beta-N-acetylhexosaminidase